MLSLVWVASAPPASKEARMNNVLRNYNYINQTKLRDHQKSALG